MIMFIGTSMYDENDVISFFSFVGWLAQFFLAETVLREHRATDLHPTIVCNYGRLFDGKIPKSVTGSGIFVITIFVNKVAISGWMS